MPAPGGSDLGRCLLPGRGGLVPGGVPGCLVETTPRMATAAGSTHPTGMHSCWISFQIVHPHSFHLS